MLARIEQALALVKNKDFKQALSLLRIINKMKKQQTFLSLQLEGFCLYQEKQYILSEQILNNAFLKASQQHEKIAILQNLKDLSILLKNPNKACQYLKQLIALEEPSTSVMYMLQICTLSFDSKNFSIVIEYAAQLEKTNDNNASLSGLVLLTASYAMMFDHGNLNLNINKILIKIGQLSPDLLVFLLNSLNESNVTRIAEKILFTVKDKYRNELWFIKQSDIVSKALIAENECVDFNEKHKDLVCERASDLVKGESIKSVTLIKKLVDELSKMGAIFNKNLTFKEEGGNLSITSSSLNQNPEFQIQVPLKCMPLLCDFRFSLDNDGKLIVKPNNKLINADALPIMQLMLDLYNETDKLNAWKQTYPLLTLKHHPELIESLFRHRPQGNKLEAFKILFNSSKWDELLINSFIGSREFSYRKESLASANIQTKNTTEKGLLSIIDFLNHQVGNTGYMVDDAKSKMNIISSSYNENKELYVQYGFMDPISTYLIYGFVDMNSPILFSGTVQLKTLTGLSVVVMSMSGRLKSTIELNTEYKHLKNYFPAGIQRDKNRIMVSDLIIPNNEFKDALPQILKAILIKCDNEGYYKDTELLLNEIKNLEKQLIENNIHYWEQYKEHVMKAISSDSKFNKNTKSDLLNLCLFCKNHLLNYQNITSKDSK